MRRGHSEVFGRNFFTHDTAVAVFPSLTYRKCGQLAEPSPHGPSHRARFAALAWHTGSSEKHHDPVRRASDAGTPVPARSAGTDIPSCASARLYSRTKDWPGLNSESPNSNTPATWRRSDAVIWCRASWTTQA